MTARGLRTPLIVAGICLVLGACAGETVSTTTTATVSTTTTATVPTTTTVTVVTTTLGDTTTSTAPAATTTPAALPLSGRLIVIDPGHNGLNWAHPEEINRPVDIGNGTKACNTTGTVSEGYAEALFNWEVAQLTVPLLEEAGATVLLTRHDNEGWGPCINQRAAVGNDAGADLMISIHADGGPAGGRGFHVIHPASIAGLTDDIYDESYRLAVALHNAFQATGMPIADYVARNGFSERGDLGGLNLSDIPAVFLEAGNMRNAEDLALLRSPDFQEKIAKAILATLVDFFSA